MFLQNTLYYNFQISGGEGIFFSVISLIAPPSRYLRGQSHNFLVPRFVIEKVHIAVTELILSLEMLQVVQMN